MSIYNLGSRASFLFEVSGTTNQLSVVNFSADEWMSCPYSVEVTCCTLVEIKSFDDIVGKEALLTIINKDFNAGGVDRYFHGVIRRFEYTGRNGRFFLYEAEVVPTLQQLSLRKNSRIFQDMQTQDIIQQILEEGSITSDRHRFALSNKERFRKFCVQYGETDLEFITRLLEEEGIFYFFEHSKDKHVLVMGDSPVVHVPIQGKPSITFNSHDGLVAEKESINAFCFSQRQQPGIYTHRNFNYKNPALDLTAKNTGANPAKFEFYDYPALHVAPNRGETLAEARLEQLTALQKQGHGQSSSCRLIPGYTFTLTDHGAQSLNGDYLITDVTHSGSQPQALEEKAGGGFSYDNTFTVIPAKTPYRPPYPGEKPIVKGVQTAIVVGPKGEEIYTDDYGRVKVQFHWDREGKRNDKSSCWLRVAQPWGGSTRGGQFIPRIGDEVLVDFIDGDPDRPIVVGSVYNSDNMPINSLKKSITQSGFKTKTHKGDGFHELRFDDAKGAEEIYLQSQKDWNILIKNDKGQNIGRDESVSVGRNKTETVAINKAETIGVAKELTIGGLYQVTVGGAMNESVGLAKAEEVGLTKAVLVGVDMNEKIISNRDINVGKNFSIKVGDSIEIVCGKSRISMKKNGDITLSGNNITIKGKKITEN
jgi:type VI secretion system secreted protein VgrG